MINHSFLKALVGRNRHGAGMSSRLSEAGMEEHDNAIDRGPSDREGI
jgi:hypothetical protein